MAAKNTVLAGRYRLLGVVASSPTGNTWRAQDELHDRVVAVKELFPVCPFDVAHSDRVRARVIREARVAIRLRHPHAITVHDVFEQEMIPYVVTEYPVAPNLAELVGRRGRLEPGEVAELGAQLASALAAAHAEGIRHGRIAPHNVVITPAGTVKITGFGLRSNSGSDTYLAPEVALGAPGFPADVYSLGATLYTALEGHPPSSELPPRASGPVLDVVLRLMHLAPQARPTMAEAGQLLTGLTLPHPRPRPKPRTQVGVFVAAALLLLAASAAVTSLAGHRIASS